MAEKTLLMITPEQFDSMTASLPPQLVAANAGIGTIKEKLRHEFWRTLERTVNTLTGNIQSPGPHPEERYVVVTTRENKNQPYIYDRVFVGTLHDHQLHIDRVLLSDRDSSFIRMLGSESIDMPLNPDNTLMQNQAQRLLNWVEPLDRPTILAAPRTPVQAQNPTVRQPLPPR